jgi:hypothetical protein
VANARAMANSVFFIFFSSAGLIARLQIHIGASTKKAR